MGCRSGPTAIAMGPVAAPAAAAGRHVGAAPLLLLLPLRPRPGQVAIPVVAVLALVGLVAVLAVLQPPVDETAAEPPALLAPSMATRVPPPRTAPHQLPTAAQPGPSHPPTRNPPHAPPPPAAPQTASPAGRRP